MQPLAERLRPTSLDGYVGQLHLVGKNGILRRVIESGSLPSFILWGPPGVGKTTLARIVSHQLKRPFYSLSAINSGVKDIREILDKAKSERFFNAPRPILFIDEIHRFSKSQQDSLLGAVENGTVTLIGATTENPSFEVIPALLSRCQVYTLKPLERSDLEFLIDFALKNDEFLKQETVEIVENEALLRYSGGDARRLLNVLELVVGAAEAKKPSESLKSDLNESVENLIRSSSDNSAEKVSGKPVENWTKRIDNAFVLQTIQANISFYDKNGEQHYDIISVFIKSIRGSDPNAAVYWLARMVEGGEDLEFIARRLVILSAEDIGLANPNALLLANACFQSVRLVGFPESRIILSETAIYLATSPKSNSAYKAINDAQSLVRQTGDLPVPLPMRNAPTQLMKQLNYGNDYKYSHDFEGNFAEQQFMPDDLATHTIYTPQNNAAEASILARLKVWWSKRYKY